MTNSEPTLAGKRLLVLDDEPFLAFEMADLLEAQGADVVGPATSVGEALDLISSAPEAIDGAVLDIQIGREMVWPVARKLADDGTPFLFVSAYRPANGLPAAFSDRICVRKPLNSAALPDQLARILPDRLAA